MQHIKNKLIPYYFNKNNNINNKLIGPSLSILKPEITAIFSILNRIFGIFLIILFTLLPTIISILNISNPFTFYLYLIGLFLSFIIIYHLIYGKLKLLLYFNDIYVLINSNIKKINNIYIIYFFISFSLIFFNILVYTFIAQFILDLSIEFIDNFVYYIIYSLILILLKYKLYSFLIWFNNYDFKYYVIMTFSAIKLNIKLLLEEDYRKEILPLIIELKELKGDIKNIYYIFVDEWKHFRNYWNS